MKPSASTVSSFDLASAAARAGGSNRRLAEQQEMNDRSLWPRDGIVLHIANPAGRDTMARTIERHAGRRLRLRRTVTGGKTRLQFAPPRD